MFFKHNINTRKKLFIFALNLGKPYSCILKQVEFLPTIRKNVLQPPVHLSKIYDFYLKSVRFIILTVVSF